MKLNIVVLIGILSLLLLVGCTSQEMLDDSSSTTSATDAVGDTSSDNSNDVVADRVETELNAVDEDVEIGQII